MEWFTTFDKSFLEKENAHEAMQMIEKSRKLFRIPNTATWSVSVRGFGIVVFAEWDLI